MVHHNSINCSSNKKTNKQLKCPDQSAWVFKASPTLYTLLLLINELMWKAFAAVKICYVLQITGCSINRCSETSCLNSYYLFVLPVLSELGAIFQLTDDLYMSLLVQVLVVSLSWSLATILTPTHISVMQKFFISVHLTTYQRYVQYIKAPGSM